MSDRISELRAIHPKEPVRAGELLAALERIVKLEWELAEANAESDGFAEVALRATNERDQLAEQLKDSQVRCSEFEKQVKAHGSESWIELQKTTSKQHARLAELDEQNDRLRKALERIAAYQTHSRQADIAGNALLSPPTGPRMVRREVLEKFIEQVKRSLTRHEKGYDILPINVERIDDALAAAQGELDRTK